MAKEESCKTCRFGKAHEVKRFKDVNHFVICRFNPVPIQKNPDEWCGKYEPKESKGRKVKEAE